MTYSIYLPHLSILHNRPRVNDWQAQLLGSFLAAGGIQAVELIRIVHVEAGSLLLPHSLCRTLGIMFNMDYVRDYAHIRTLEIQFGTVLFHVIPYPDHGRSPHRLVYGGRCHKDYGCDTLAPEPSYNCLEVLFVLSNRNMAPCCPPGRKEENICHQPSSHHQPVLFKGDAPSWYLIQCLYLSGHSIIHMSNNLTPYDS